MTQQEVREKYYYNRETGVFFTRYRSEVVGTLHHDGYIILNIDGVQYGIHRLAWLYVHGEFPECIDHINHCRSDNRIINLRDVSRAENQKNMSKRIDNTSGVTGVVWDKVNKKWRAQIQVEGVSINLGRYLKFSEAVDTRMNAEVLYGFHSNHGKGD